MQKSGLLIAVSLVGITMCIAVPSTLTEICVFKSCNLTSHCDDSIIPTTSSGTCTIDHNVMINVIDDNCTFLCKTGNYMQWHDSSNHISDTIAIPIIGILGITNLITIISCGIALCISRRNISSLKHLRNSLHQEPETEERVVNNPTYEEQCNNLDSAKGCASGQPTELSAQYSHLGPAYYESSRGVNQRVMMKGDLGDGKRSNKRLVRHTEPINCSHTYYHEVHSDALHQWQHRVLPSDSHNYSRLYH